ncbi:MAG: AAA family ATPase [Desulfobacteraceae bacterium]|jgi:pilus assembly protein CpaE
MSDGNRAIILTENAGKGERLANEIRPAMDSIKRIDDYETAYSTIKESGPDAVFIFLSENTKRDMQLTRRITGHLPDTRVFLIADENNPDIILEGLRARVTDYLVFPNSNGSLLKSVRQAMGSSNSQAGELIAVFSIKGGQGNTTVSINLADHIQKLTGEKVLLSDFNLYRGDIGTGLDISSSYTGFDLIRDIKRMDKNLLFSSLYHHSRGFYVLPSPEEISDADQISPEDINFMLSLMKQYMDYTIIDMPHDLSERSLTLLDSVDKILVIAQQTLPVIKSVQRTLELFEDLHYGAGKVEIVLNRNCKNEEFNSNDLANIFKQRVLAEVTNDYRSVTQSLNRGRPVSMVKENSRLNEDFRRLAGAVTGIKTGSAGMSGWKGLVSQLFGK